MKNSSDKHASKSTEKSIFLFSIKPNGDLRIKINCVQTLGVFVCVKTALGSTYVLLLKIIHSIFYM